MELYINLLIPINNSNLVVQNVIVWFVVFKFSLVSLLTGINGVLEKHAVNVV